MDKLKQKNLPLTDQCSLHQQTLETSKRVIATVNTENDHLENIAIQQKNNIQELEKVISLTSEIINLRYPGQFEKLGIFSLPMQRMFKQCLPSTTQHQCPAVGTKCKLCDETDHFNITSPDKAEFILSS